MGLSVLVAAVCRLPTFWPRLVRTSRLPSLRPVSLPAAVPGSEVSSSVPWSCASLLTHSCASWAFHMRTRVLTPTSSWLSTLLSLLAPCCPSLAVPECQVVQCHCSGRSYHPHRRCWQHPFGGCRHELDLGQHAPRRPVLHGPEHDQRTDHHLHHWPRWSLRRLLRQAPRLDEA